MTGDGLYHFLLSRLSDASTGPDRDAQLRIKLAGYRLVRIKGRIGEAVVC